MSNSDAALLVVDDIDDNRFALTRRLARQGYLNVTTAADGRQALELLNSRPFDLVLLDIMMPNLNGYEVLARNEGKQQPPAHPRHHDFRRRRDRQRHSLHRAGRRGLPAQALQSDPVARPGRRLPGAQTAARPGDGAHARARRVAGAADGDLRGAERHLQFARRAGAGLPGHAGECHAHLRAPSSASFCSSTETRSASLRMHGVAARLCRGHTAARVRLVPAPGRPRTASSEQSRSFTSRTCAADRRIRSHELGRMNSRGARTIARRADAQG